MTYKKGYRFHGNNYNTPGVYSYVKSDMRANKSNGALNIAIIGNAKGGVPNEITFLDDAEIAKEVLKGGDLLTGCLKAYDPVKETKEAVALGGADLILAVRSNNATKAQTSVYQAKEVAATIGEVTTTKHANTTGKLTVKGTYTGKENKTYKVVITSEGTKELKDCTYNVLLASDNSVLFEDLKLSDTKNATSKDIGEGVLVTFGEGNYTLGDTFLIPCSAAVTTSEFVYKIESKDYGEECNKISHKLEDGTLEGTKKLTIYNQKNDSYEILDNLGAAFSIKYTGTEKYAVMSIVPDGKGNSIKLQTRKGNSKEDAIIDLDIDLDTDNYKTVKQLAQFIDGFENYEVELATTTSPELTVEDLDFMQDKSIKETVNVTAVLRNLKKTTKDLSNLVEVTLINREVSNYQDYPYTNLAGGTEGKDATSYINILDKLAAYDVDYIVPLTDDITILAEVREHCILMSEKQGKERRMICGGSNNMSASAAIQLAKRLAHERVQCFGVGYYDFDNKLYPGYMAAAMHAGRVAFLGVESATGDVYNVLKPEKTFEGLERDNLINNGVMFFDEVTSDYNHKQFLTKLVWDYTTFTEYDDPLRVERSTGAIADRLSKEIRKKMERMLTGKLTPVGVLESARNAVLTILKDYIKKGIILEYRNVQIKKVRDKTNIVFEVAPTQVNNFTFVDVLFYSKDIIL